MFQVHALYIGSDRNLSSHIVNREFSNRADAEEFALKANCKAYTPYFFSVIECLSTNGNTAANRRL